MIGPNPVLEENLTRLIQRAYQPVRPTAAFRQQVAQKVEQVLARHDARPRSRPWPRIVRYGLPLAAACVLALLGLRPLFAPAAPKTGETRTLASLLAEGHAAVRTQPAGGWRAASDEERARGLEFDGDYLELATPEAGEEALLAALFGERRFVLGAGGHAVLGPREPQVLSSPSPAPRVRLERGTATLHAAPSEAADAGWQLESAGGVVRLAQGDLSVRLAPGPEPCLELNLLGGRATAFNRNAQRSLSAGFHRLCGSALAQPPSDSGDEGDVLDGGTTDPTRSGIPGPDEADPDAAPSAVGQTPDRGILAGTVLDAATDAPLDELSVWLLRKVGLPQASHPTVHPFSAAGGAFSCRGIEPGTYTVFVRSPGYASRQLADVAVRAGETTSVEARLEAGRTLRGHVVDARTATPLEGAIVVSETDAPMQLLPLWDEGYIGELPGKALTRRDGSFELEHVSSGTHILRASHPDIGAEWHYAVEVEDEDQDGRLFQIAAGGRLVGNVERDDGTPWSGSAIVACIIDMTGRRRCMSFATAEVAADGGYRIDNLPPGHYVVLHFPDLEQEGEPRVRYVEVVALEEARIDFAPQRGSGSVAGRVLRPDGTPAPHMGVLLIEDGKLTTDSWEAAPAGADGSYRFDNVSPGDYVLMTSEAMDREITVQGRVRVEAGDETRHDLQLAPGRLHGRVSDGQTGDGVPDVTVVLQRRHEGNVEFRGRFTTGPDGRFEADTLAPGDYDVIAVPPRAYGAERSAPVLVSADGRPARVEVPLYPGGSVRVVVSDEAGEAVQGATLHFVDAAGADRDTGPAQSSDARGEVVQRGLRPGRVQLRVRKPGYVPLTLTCEVQATLETTVPVTLEREP